MTSTDTFTSSFSGSLPNNVKNQLPFLSYNSALFSSELLLEGTTLGLTAKQPRTSTSHSLRRVLVLQDSVAH